MKFKLMLFFLLAAGLYACEKGTPTQEQPQSQKEPGVKTGIGTKVIINQSYLTDTTKAIDSNYEKFAGVWRLTVFVCGTCGVDPRKPDTTEILTLRRNGQYERIRSDTVYFTGTYNIRYDYRCGSTAAEKTFLFEDVASIENAKKSSTSFPLFYLSSTISISDPVSPVLTIAAPKCMVDMDGYKTYKRITE
ncbi:hypothetical protein [Niabella aurantiaca]|uniref:hypothetical protein n=1 Tax=Niabella aurantiaca TaxID=379900 RepID=UPI000369F0F6|nr:hypothetical protein [Niabella aurantiaca]